MRKSLNFKNRVHTAGHPALYRSGHRGKHFKHFLHFIPSKEAIDDKVQLLQYPYKLLPRGDRHTAIIVGNKESKRLAYKQVRIQSPSAYKNSSKHLDYLEEKAGILYRGYSAYYDSVDDAIFI